MRTALLRVASSVVLCVCPAVLLVSCGGSSSSTQTVQTVNVSPTTASVSVNGQEQFTATAVDSNGNTVSGQTFTWASSNSNVATVDTTGLATGKNGGTTQITATTSNITSSAANLTVSPSVSTVTLSPMSATITVGQTQQFTATATDANGNPITGTTFTWKNSFAGVATIDSNGLATGISPGTVSVQACLGTVCSPLAMLTITQ